MISQLLSDELDYLTGFGQGQIDTLEADECPFGRWLEMELAIDSRLEDLDMLHRQLHEFIELSVRLEQFGEQQAANEQLSLAYRVYSCMLTASKALETDG